MKIRIEAHGKNLTTCGEQAPLESPALVKSDKPAISLQ